MMESARLIGDESFQEAYRRISKGGHEPHCDEEVHTNLLYTNKGEEVLEWVVALNGQCDNKPLGFSKAWEIRHRLRDGALVP